ncbi:glycosyltransferase [Spiribacter vilamensis]|uniref:Colanic acid/amylovoran biosynthesis glycosyltransferase n=1 Tax=Spiribacter vilamensis TaxID=531306 RepID=A0A4Q8CZE7_9GAMM|nr:glycosyltransferase [Spiribacter vilamensis]RZU98354.1 colanic acid/amylovoran biosynthesis glycosyltransferase [Spiribacter vilamensis]TVO60763.1 colanic acid biosynthesis glycosyltransferase WcaL [Spiribacter vilamensis]
MVEHATRPTTDVIVNTASWLPLTERWIYTQVAYLPSSIRSHVVCRSTRDADQVPVPRLNSYDALTPGEKCRVLYRGGRRLGGHLRRRTALIAHVAEQTGAGIVHSHFGYAGYMVASAVNRLGLRHIVTFYGVDMSALPQADPRWHDRYSELFGLADRVLCEGEHMAGCLADLGCPAEKLRVHHLGVDTGALEFRPRQRQPDEPLRVLMAASFREKKGLTYGIRALALLAERVPVELTLIGDAGSHPKSVAEKHRIEAVLAETGLMDRTRLLGYQPYARLLKESDAHHVFLSPSVTASDGDTEGGAPVTLIEMAAIGIPIVSSRHADIPGVVEDGVGGLLADEGDVKGLAACLARFVDEPALSWELTAAARRHVEQSFDASAQGRALAAVYSEFA